MKRRKFKYGIGDRVEICRGPNKWVKGVIVEEVGNDGNCVIQTSDGLKEWYVNGEDTRKARPPQYEIEVFDEQ